MGQVIALRIGYKHGGSYYLNPGCAMFIPLLALSSSCVCLSIFLSVCLSLSPASSFPTDDAIMGIIVEF